MHSSTADAKSSGLSCHVAAKSVSYSAILGIILAQLSLTRRESASQGTARVLHSTVWRLASISHLCGTELSAKVPVVPACPPRSRRLCERLVQTRNIDFPDPDLLEHQLAEAKPPNYANL